MSRFVPKEKMSKKDRKKLESQHRVTWQCSPVTKVIKSKKQYDRHRKSRDFRMDETTVFLCLSMPRRLLPFRMEHIPFSVILSKAH
jgi:hypothetical protein